MFPFWDGVRADAGFLPTFNNFNNYVIVIGKGREYSSFHFRKQKNTQTSKTRQIRFIYCFNLQSFQQLYLCKILMVYIPRITFKTGINPSLISQFPVSAPYSGTQKLMLSRTRIFGDKISGNYRSGMKPWRATLGARFGWIEHETVQLHNIWRQFPYLREQNVDHAYRVMKERKMQSKLKKEAKQEAKKQAKKKK